jgi:hypothetical protein
MNDFDPQAPKRMNMVNQQQINNTRIESYSNTLRHRESSVGNEHPFIYHFWLRLGDGIIIPLPTLSRPGRNYSKKKRNKAISAPTVFQRRFAKYTKMPEILCENRPPVQSVLTKARKPSENTHSSTPSSFYTQVFSTLLSCLS